MGKSSFAKNLDRSLGYIRGFSTSYVLQALIADGTLEKMSKDFTVESLATEQGYRPELFKAVVEYLVTEEILDEGPAPDTFKLSSFGNWISKQPGWFNLLVGGYQNVFSDLSKILKEGSHVARRNSHFVGLGSYEISIHDAFPIVWKLIDRVEPNATRFVDIGCGDGYFVREICDRIPNATAIGVEPSESAENARKAIDEAGLGGRIEIVRADGFSYPVPKETDFLLFAFVLQEILPQVNERELIRYFQDLRKSGFKGNVLIIEVDYAPGNTDVMRTPMGLGYYNPYNLLHPLTGQQLMPLQFWKDLFAEAGYDLVAEQIVDPAVDPTGLEVGLVFSPNSE